MKYEHEKEMQDLKDRLKGEIQELMLENQALQARTDDRRDQDIIKQLRRDLDEAKRRANDLNQDLNEIRREKENIKLEKNQNFLEYSKDLEELKNKNREF